MTSESLFRLERDGLGFQRNAGFGRVAVNLHGPGGIFAVSKAIEREIHKLQPRAGHEAISLDMEKDQGIIRLPSLILGKRAEAMLQGRAMQIIDRASDFPSASTISRVALILRQDDWMRNALREIDKFREPARNALDKCRLVLPEGKKTSLLQFLREHLSDHKQLGESYLREAATKGGKRSLNHFVDEDGVRRICSVDSDAPSRLVRHYLLDILKYLSLRIRTQEDGK
jgi:hypothetical protein